MKKKTKDVINEAMRALDAAIELAENVGDTELAWGFSYTHANLWQLIHKEENETTC